MKEVWVVWCKMEGCGECNNTCSIIGVFESRDVADKVEREHQTFGEKHLHYPSTDIERVELNQAIHFWGDTQQFVR